MGERLKLGWGETPFVYFVRFVVASCSTSLPSVASAGRFLV